MKKIIFIFIFIFLMNFSFSLEDNSPPNQPVNYETNPTLVNAGMQSQLVILNGSISELGTKIDSKASTQDLENFKQSINQDLNARNTVLLSDILVLLLVFTIFFFSIFFLAIAKGWLVNGK